MNKPTSRRSFLSELASTPAILAFASTPASVHGKSINDTPYLKLTLNKSFKPDTSRRHLEKIKKATMDFVEKNYNNRNLPTWRKPYRQIDLEKRIHWAIYWAMVAIDNYKNRYFPIDPVWIVAQIMAESFFYEFAISHALAVGPCQFMRSTATSYGLICAGDKPEHYTQDYQSHQLAGKWQEIRKLKKTRRKFIKKHKKFKKLNLEKALTALASQNTQLHQQAQKQLELAQTTQHYRKQIKEAKQGYKKYLKDNFKNRDIFNHKDGQYLVGFDERISFRRSVPAMVKMLSWALAKRNGNIMIAAAAYNAGLSRTVDQHFITNYGRIPNINETPTYVSRIMINYIEIVARLS